MNQATDKSGSIRPGFSFHTENTFRVAARESRGKPWRFVGFPASIRYLHHGIFSSFALDRSSLVFVPFVSSLLVSRSSRGTGLRDAPVRRACFSIPREPRLRLVHAPSISIRAHRKDFSTRRERIANEGREICTRIAGVAVNSPRSTGKFVPHGFDRGHSIQNHRGWTRDFEFNFDSAVFESNAHGIATLW